jgi:predicted ribosomally synthesized peptide with SipW-like signal peptide
VISAVLATVSIGGALASFTDSQSDSGTVTAGSVSIRLNTLKGVNEVTWNGGGCVSDTMAPGDVCTATLAVHNDGLAIYYEITDLETACFDVSHDPPIDSTGGDDGINPGHLAPGETESVAATVEVVDDNACQGASASVGIMVVGTSEAPGP